MQKRDNIQHDVTLIDEDTKSILTRDGHADIFGDAYVGYSAILSDNAEFDADICIRMAIPNMKG